MNYHEHRARRDAGDSATEELDERIQKLYRSPYAIKAFENICFIAELLKKKDRDAKVGLLEHCIPNCGGRGGRRSGISCGDADLFFYRDAKINQ
ncbi:unnamed protein product [Gongylonema pulchrum]|uniref:NTP_transf_2 domain-containing protein n=1 Tax=Gongylonema pulchrum TaxID=637853 RepID=A0A183F1L3_9BILA|nr:unnamed protein product [Gongylonema pulchrum]